MILGIQDAGTGNHKIRWTQEEFRTYKPYAKRYHVSYCLLVALRKAENGREGKELGQASISSEIRQKDPKSEWQVAQAARTLSRAIIGFVAKNPEFVENYDWKPGEVTWEGFLWEYRTKFIDHLAYEGWAPEANPRTWAFNVKYLWEQEQRKVLS